MKKSVLTLFALTAISYSVSAQGIHIGPRFGIGFTNLSASSGIAEDRDNFNDNTKYKTGIFGGLALNVGLNDNFSVQPELLYSTQGYQMEFEDASANLKIKDKFTTSYIKLPVLARYSFLDGDFRVFVNAGPYVSYWISGEQDYKYEVDGTEDPTMSFKESIKFEDDAEGNGYNRLDVGLTGGAGVSVNAGPGMLTFDFRYDYGLSDIHKYKNDRPNDEFKLSNRGFNFGIGYMFGFGN